MTLDPKTRRDIERATERILRDAGFRSPPVHIDPILETLRVERDFYALDDPGLLKSFGHKVRVGGRRLKRLAEKVKLHGLWLPDRERILIDPHYQQEPEVEANCGAAHLAFCGSCFEREARDISPGWEGLGWLVERYDKSFESTLRRYVTYGSDVPMVMVVSRPPWEADLGASQRSWIYFERSPSYVERFDYAPVASWCAAMESHLVSARNGDIATCAVEAPDARGDRYEFRGEAKWNGYRILHLFWQSKALTAERIVLARSIPAPAGGPSR